MYRIKKKVMNISRMMQTNKAKSSNRESLLPCSFCFLALLFLATSGSVL